MLISDKQIIFLLDIAMEYAIKLYETDCCKDEGRKIAIMVKRIKDQQSDLLNETGLK